MLSSGSTTTDQNNDVCTCFTKVEESTRHIKETTHPTTAAWTGYDCSERLCPYGYAHASSPQGSFTAVKKSTDRAIQDGHDWSECSNMGKCDRKTGACTCFAGFSGHACEKRNVLDTALPVCSGHGTLLSEEHLHRSASDFYEDVRVAEVTSSCTSKMCKEVSYSKAWDSAAIHGCECDPQWYGSNCEWHTCPSKADPNGGPASSNGRDCSGRGLCDGLTGLCTCFSGFYGTACELQTALV